MGDFAAELKMTASAAEKLIRQEIERRGGLDFASFTDIALYHPKYGYYNSAGIKRGRAGDYFTSMQVSDLFPRVFADAFLQMKETLGSDQFSLIEIGAGSGEFLEGVLAAMAEKRERDHSRASAVRVWAVERSRPARDLLSKRLSRFPRCTVVESVNDIDWMGTLEGCIFSNEFFDALPFHRVRWRGGKWNEVSVAEENGVLVERERETEFSLDGSDLQEGHEITWRPQIPDIYKEWSSWLSRGYVLTVDYGHPRESFLSPTRSNGSWMCFHKHESNKNPYEKIGSQDITAHVDFTQLVQAGRAADFEPALFCSQGIFLSFLGQAKIEDWLKEATDENRRQRMGAVQQLIHPDAMGESFWTLLQRKGVEMPPAFETLPNRLRRLI